MKSRKEIVETLKGFIETDERIHKEGRAIDALSIMALEHKIVALLWVLGYDLRKEYNEVVEEFKREEGVYEAQGDSKNDEGKVS